MVVHEHLTGTLANQIMTVVVAALSDQPQNILLWKHLKKTLKHTLVCHQDVDYLFSLWVFHLICLSRGCLYGKFFKELEPNISTMKSYYGAIKSFDNKIHILENIQMYYCKYSHFFFLFYLSSPFSPFFLLWKKSSHNSPTMFFACFFNSFFVSFVSDT